MRSYADKARSYAVLPRSYADKARSYADVTAQLCRWTNNKKNEMLKAQIAVQVLCFMSKMSTLTNKWLRFSDCFKTGGNFASVQIV